MIKNFMDNNFLLETPTAQELFHSEAENLPIIDYVVVGRRPLQMALNEN